MYHSGSRPWRAGAYGEATRCVSDAPRKRSVSNGKSRWMRPADARSRGECLGGGMARGWTSQRFVNALAVRKTVRTVRPRIGGDIVR